MDKRSSHPACTNTRISDLVVLYWKAQTPHSTAAVWQWRLKQAAVSPGGSSVTVWGHAVRLGDGASIATQDYFGNQEQCRWLTERKSKDASRGTHPEFFFGGKGGGGDPDVIYNLCSIFKTRLRKSRQKISQPTSSSLTGKIKNKRGKMYIFLCFYFIFKYPNAPVFSRCRWLV